MPRCAVLAAITIRDIKKTQGNHASQDKDISSSQALQVEEHPLSNVTQVEESTPIQTPQVQEPSLSTIEECLREIDRLKSVIHEKDKQIDELKSKHNFGVHSIKNSDDMVKVYTGLSSYSLFSWLFDEVKEPAKNMTYYRGENSNTDKQYQVNNKNKPGPKRKLLLEDELLILLIKLRHNLNVDLIAAMFNVSTSLISVTITTWLSLLALELKPLIYWPPREELLRWYPDCFKRYGDNVCAVIDASEVQTERPSMTNINSILYSNYKQRHTFKVLVACTPGGSISFISEAAGGDMSDVELVRKS
ncbi:uncharacterized protein LOC110238116 [Exaiptasia diaphana]|uniref:Transposase n=1 Tax=Exaiptasia diaphana TaxID=2652724 RepID=A0A913YJC3_EXADI|nr:uncharacterized protein LOC110238116 [Exaiptasia diaphana]